MQCSEILNWLTSTASHCTGDVLLAHATYAKYFKVFLLCVAAPLIPCHLLRKLPIKKINLPCVVKGLHSSTKVPTSHTQSGSRSCARCFLLKSTRTYLCVKIFFVDLEALKQTVEKTGISNTSLLLCHRCQRDSCRFSCIPFHSYHRDTLEKKYSRAILSDPSQLLS